MGPECLFTNVHSTNFSNKNTENGVRFFGWFGCFCIMFFAGSCKSVQLWPPPRAYVTVRYRTLLVRNLSATFWVVVRYCTLVVCNSMAFLLLCQLTTGFCPKRDRTPKPSHVGDLQMIFWNSCPNLLNWQKIPSLSQISGFNRHRAKRHIATFIAWCLSFKKHFQVTTSAQGWGIWFLFRLTSVSLREPCHCPSSRKQNFMAKEWFHFENFPFVLCTDMKFAPESHTFIKPARSQS